MGRVEQLRIWRREWALRNRDYVNMKRRERRLRKRVGIMGEKRCLLCDILMVSTFGGCRRNKLYCNSCLTNDYERVRKDTKKRHELKKLCMKTL